MCKGASWVAKGMSGMLASLDAINRGGALGLFVWIITKGLREPDLSLPFKIVAGGMITSMVAMCLVFGFLSKALDSLGD